MKVCLGIPVLYVVPGREFYSHLHVAAGLAGFDWICPPTLNKTPYSNARNHILREAKKQECDYVYFVDADQGIPSGAFSLLLEAIQKTGAQVVSAYYNRRYYPFDTVWRAAAGHCESNNGTVEILGCGMGCTLIDLPWILQRMDDPWFLEPPEGGTEDYPFCEKVRELGGRVLGHTGIICDHEPVLPAVNAANVELCKKLHEQSAAFRGA